MTSLNPHHGSGAHFPPPREDLASGTINLVNNTSTLLSLTLPTAGGQPRGQAASHPAEHPARPPRCHGPLAPDIRGQGRPGPGPPAAPYTAP